MTGDETGKNGTGGEETAVERDGTHDDTPGHDIPEGDVAAHEGQHDHDGPQGPDGDPRSGDAKTGRKRPKKHRDKDLAELLSRKNEMLQDLENRLAESEQAIAKYEDRLLRLAAEFENYKKRTRREWELHEKQANAGLVKGLLHVLDDFARALEASEDAGGHFREGIRLISASLTEVLARNGLREIEAAGKPFDPQFHEAVGEIEAGEIEPGRVAEVLQRGYMFHDQVLRPARVLVAKETGGDGGSD